VILHLAPAADWDEVPAGGTYAPASLATEGFVHCTGDDETLLRVANAFYRQLPGELVVLTLDETRLGAQTKWEAPAHPHPDAAPDQGHPLRFPHVYGPLERDAVVLERRFVRTPDGTCTGYEPRA
jgi:uncharacterized protein (DUF952 family)